MAIDDVLGNAKVKITADAADLKKDLDKAEALVEQRVAKQAKTLAKMGASLTAAFTIPIALATRSIVKLGVEFEAQLNKSLAQLGKVSEAQRREMAKTAVEVSKITTQSAATAAAAYADLVSAGYDAEQSIGALPQVALLAQANLIDLTSAVQIATQAQAALGLVSKDTDRNFAGLAKVTDVLTRAAIDSKANIFELSDSLSVAGNSLRVLNKDIEEGLAALSAFSDRGAKGAESGGLLAAILEQLPKVAARNAKEFARLGIDIFDSQGQMKHLADVAKELAESLGDLSPQQRVAAFNALGISRALADAVTMLMEMETQIREYEAALRSAGGATAEVAQSQIATAEARWTIFTNQIDASALALYDAFGPAIKAVLLPALESAAAALETLTGYFAGLPDASKMAIGAFVAMTAAIGPLAIAIGAATVAYGLFVTAVGAPMVAAAGVAIAAIAALGAVAMATVVTYKAFQKDIDAILSAVAGTFREIGESIAAAWRYGVAVTTQFFGTMIGYFNEFLRSSSKFGENLYNIFVDTWNQIGETFALANKNIGGLENFPGFIKNWGREMKEGASVLLDLIGNKDFFGKDLDTGKKELSLIEKLKGSYKALNAEIENTFTGGMGEIDFGTEEAAKELEKLKEEAAGMRLQLFPEEALAEDVARVLEFADKFPAIFDAPAVHEAFKAIWKDYKDKGIESMEAVVNAMPGVTEEIKRMFSEATAEAAADAEREAEKLKAKKEAERRAEKLESDKESALTLLTNLTLDANPIEKVQESLQEVVDAMNLIGAALPQDVLEFLAGNYWDQFGEGGAEAVRILIDRFRELSPEIAKALEKIEAKEVAKKAKENWGKVGEIAAGFGEILGALPDKYKKLKEVGGTAMRVIQAATALAKGAIGAFEFAVMLAVEALGFLGDEGEKEIKGIDKAFQELGDSLEAWGDQFTDMLVEFARTGKLAFKDMVDTILSDILRVVVQLTVTDPIVDFIKDMFAQGGAFGAGGVQYMAKGGIVPVPTIFGLSGGKIGVAGEAGPEAVMPLSRTDTGDLGVIAIPASGGTVVQIIDQRGANEPPPTQTTRRAANGDEVTQIVFRSMQYLADTGQLDPVLSRNFGLARRGGRF